MPHGEKPPAADKYIQKGRITSRQARRMGLILDDARPLVRGEFRDNKDGTRSTERLIGVQIDGRETLIPSIWMTPDGIVELGEKKAREFALQYMKESGKKFPSFSTQEEAEQFAIGRSNSGGVFSGELAKGIGQ